MTYPWGIAKNMLLRMAAWFGAGHLVLARSCTSPTVYRTYYILVSKCLLEDMKNHGFQRHFQDKKTATSQLLYGKSRLVVHAREECSEIILRLTKKPLTNSRGNKTKIFTDHEKTLYHHLPGPTESFLVKKDEAFRSVVSFFCLLKPSCRGPEGARKCGGEGAEDVIESYVNADL